MSSLAAKTMDRREWSQLPPLEQASKIKEGFKLVDVEEAFKPFRTFPVGAKMMDRREWSQLPPLEQASKIKEGFKLVD
jgi:hypothetical protein